MDRKLYEAATSGNVQPLFEIIQTDVRLLSSQPPHGNTALHIAARLGHKDVTREILSHCIQLLKKENLQGDTPLHCAAKNGRLEVVQILISSSTSLGEANDGILRMMNKEGNTALHEALTNQHGDVAIKLLGSDPELALIANYLKESPLHLAVRDGLRKVVLKMLGISPPDSSAETSDTGGEISENRKRDLVMMKDSKGKTALHYAAWKNNVELVDMILRIDPHLAPYSTDDEGFSPLHVAASFGSRTAISKLLEHCPDAIEQLDRDGRNALHIAVLNCQAKTIWSLLKIPNAEQLLNQQNQRGNTPVHLAALDVIDLIFKQNYSVFYKLAHDRRTDPNLMNKAGHTASDMCFLHSLRVRQTAAEGGRIMPLVIPGGSVQKREGARNIDETYMLIATLIATVTFAAGITVPGGFNSSGSVVLADRVAFQAFMLFDTIALCLSLCANFVLLAGWNPNSKSGGRRHLILGSFLTYLASDFMLFAFGTGVYVVLSPQCKWLAILVLLVSFSMLWVFAFASTYVYSSLMNADLFSPFQ